MWAAQTQDATASRSGTDAAKREVRSHTRTPQLNRTVEHFGDSVQAARPGLSLCIDLCRSHLRYTSPVAGWVSASAALTFAIRLRGNGEVRYWKVG